MWIGTLPTANVDDPAASEIDALRIICHHVNGIVPCLLPVSARRLVADGKLGA